MLVESTRSQNAVGLRRANALRVLLMFGSAPSRPSPRVASLRDFCSASCCARSTRMDHAMSERHTAVVSEPPMFVMCIAPARRGERGNGGRAGATPPKSLAPARGFDFPQAPRRRDGRRRAAECCSLLETWRLAAGSKFVPRHPAFFSGFADRDSRLDSGQKSCPAGGKTLSAPPLQRCSRRGKPPLARALVGHCTLARTGARPAPLTRKDPRESHARWWLSPRSARPSGRRRPRTRPDARRPPLRVVASVARPPRSIRDARRA